MIEMLDMKKQWSKVKAGFMGGPFYKMPAHGPNPKTCVDGPGAMTRQAQQVESMPKGSVFGGKTFSQKHG